MTFSAWIMLTVTWSIIIYFCGKYFWRVCASRHFSSGKPDDSSED